MKEGYCIIMNVSLYFLKPRINTRQLGAGMCGSHHKLLGNMFQHQVAYCILGLRANNYFKGSLTKTIYPLPSTS